MKMLIVNVDGLKAGDYVQVKTGENVVAQYVCAHDKKAVCHKLTLIPTYFLEGPLK